MKADLLKILRADTAEWWWHAELLRRGDPESMWEFRYRTRRSIRETVSTMRMVLASPGGYITLCRGRTTCGWSGPFAGGTLSGTLSGYSLRSSPAAAALLAMGVPGIDMRFTETDAALFRMPTPSAASRASLDHTLDYLRESHPDVHIINA